MLEMVTLGIYKLCEGFSFNKKLFMPGIKYAGRDIALVIIDKLNVAGRLVGVAATHDIVDSRTGFPSGNLAADVRHFIVLPGTGILAVPVCLPVPLGNSLTSRQRF